MLFWEKTRGAWRERRVREGRKKNGGKEQKKGEKEGKGNEITWWVTH